LANINIVTTFIGLKIAPAQSRLLSRNKPVSPAVSALAIAINLTRLVNHQKFFAVVTTGFVKDTHFIKQTAWISKVLNTCCPLFREARTRETFIILHTRKSNLQKTSWR
jgi:hypothetical protein